MSFNDETPMPFGRYKGKPLKDVPASYLLWWNDECTRDQWRDLQEYIKKNIDALKIKDLQK